MAMDNFLSYVLLTKVGGIYRHYAIRENHAAYVKTS